MKALRFLGNRVEDAAKKGVTVIINCNYQM